MTQQIDTIKALEALENPDYDSINKIIEAMGNTYAAGYLYFEFRELTRPNGDDFNFVVNELIYTCCFDNIWK